VPTATQPPTPQAWLWLADKDLLDNFPPNAPLVVRFNQPMNPESAKPELIFSPAVEGTANWDATHTRFTFAPAADFELGQRYHVRLNPYFVSASGLALAEAPEWEVKMLGLPKVVRRLPGRTQLDERRPAIQLAFDRPMNPESVAAALSVQPSLPYDLRWEKNITATLNLLKPLTPGMTYRFILAQTASDVYGFALARDYEWNYQARTVVGTVTGPTMGHPTAPLIVHFNYPMDAASVERALTITPFIAGTLSWDTARTTFTFSPTIRYTSDTTYTLAFTDPLRDIQGDGLPPPEPVSLTTPPPIISVSPGSEEFVDPRSSVRIAFDRLVDRASVEAAFHFQPETEGYFEWEDNTMVFRPRSGFMHENAAYTAILSATARAAAGGALLKADMTWVFFTGVLPDVAVFGQGPKAQVIDVNGSRTIRFAVLEQASAPVTFELYRLSPEQFINRYAASGPGWATPLSTRGATLAHTWSEDVSQAQLESYQGRLWETHVPADAPPGAYLLNMGTERVNDQLLLLITRHLIALRQAEGQLLAWVTDWSGAPVAEAEVTVYNHDGIPLSAGRTDADGLYRARLSSAQPFLVISRLGEEVTAVGLGNEWSSPGRYWQDWGRLTPMPASPDYRVYLYTDRPIYRPGQTVYFKAIVRHDEDAVLSLPENAALTARLYDARGNVVRTIYLTPNEFGTVSSLFRIAEGAMLGNYAVEVTIGNESYRHAFKVQDYRKPDYEVHVTTDAARYIVGETIRISVDSQYLFGQPVANARVVVKQYELGPNYYCEWTCSAEEVWYDSYRPEITSQTDAEGRFEFTLSAEKGYTSHKWGIEVTVDDGSHQAVSNFAVVEVFNPPDPVSHDPGSPASSSTPEGGLNITPDKAQYAPGDMASLLIESSFSGPALLTFERSTIRRTQLVQLTAPATRVEALIQPDDAPNLFITVSAWKEVSAPSPERHQNGQEWYAWFTTTPERELLTASTTLHVPASDKALTITLTPDKENYTLREQATFTVHVTNHKGEPVRAEVSLALVDEAIFNLSDDLTGPIFSAFYAERGHPVNLFDSMALRRLLTGNYCEGWCCDCGGGGGGGGPTFAKPRQDFPDNALWEPEIHTDANGEAVITLTLPDSLTSWRLTAKAVTMDTQVGEAQINVVTRQEIVVRPLLPRTLTMSDTVELSAIVHNYADGLRTIAVGIEVSKLRLAEASVQTITLAPNEQRIVGWAATALEVGEATITVQADAGGTGDAVRLTLPIQPRAVPDVTIKLGEFKDEFRTALLMPSDALGVSTVKIELSRSIAGSLLTGLEYLTGYPYGCVEQTMSKAFPNAVIGRAFHQLGLGDPGRLNELRPKIDASVQRLYGFQHNDGGWGWWWDDPTDAYQTAWVVLGLSLTKEAGYEVDEGVIQRGSTWLSDNLHTMDVRTRAFALYSLAIAGRGNLESTQALAKQADDLDTFSQAAVALALHELGLEAEARAMLNVLARAAVVADGQVYWPTPNEDGHYHEKTMSSTTRSTALALEAFVQINPDHELEPGIVRYLLGQRRAEGWGSTNETSFTILALTDHLLVTEMASEEAQYSVELNDQVIASGSLGRGNPMISLEIPADQLEHGLNWLRLGQSGGGKLYYVVNSRMYVAQPEIGAAGPVQVSRTYFDPQANRPITGSVAANQLVRVQLTVTLPQDGFYMLVEDKLPGGLEALNESLNTTSHEGQAYCYDYTNCEGYRWQEYGYNNKEVRGDRVSLFITELRAGTHTFSYLARATRPGAFVALPAEASAMYDLTLWGRSASSELGVGE
jgi:uncharacterized protein YfaS (alpha-2-macroglobulin family)